MIVLGVETSCDDTGIALYDTNKGLIKHILSSQIKIHNQYGGVVPEIASREHSNHIVKCFNQLIDTNMYHKIKAVAYTAGPGLTGALMVGAVFAHSFAQALQIPNIPINHLEGHLFSAFLPNHSPKWPCLMLLVSGGHTAIVWAKGLGDYTILGETLDDAAGEAFDKTAKLLGLPYPGGAHLAKMATQGNKDRFTFTMPLQGKDTLDFSFSGLKSAALRHWQNCSQTQNDKHDLAASFENIVTSCLAQRIIQAHQATRCDNIIIVGGVSANQELRRKVAHLNVLSPPLEFCTDNGAMIAAAGAHRIHSATMAPAINIYARWPLDTIKD